MRRQRYKEFLKIKMDFGKAVQRTKKVRMSQPHFWKIAFEVLLTNHQSLGFLSSLSRCFY
jgi:hypothetical protein